MNREKEMKIKKWEERRKEEKYGKKRNEEKEKRRKINKCKTIRKKTWKSGKKD